MYLTAVMGPMFSGKTSTIVRFLNSFVRSKTKKCIFIRPTLDSRENISHDPNVQLDSEVSVVRDLSQIEHYDIIGIDEGQFFLDVDWRQIFNRYEKTNKQIMIGYLSGDYQRNPFPKTEQLISISDDLLFLKSRCHQCAKFAPFTVRKVFNSSLIVIGSGEMYAPSCRDHFSIPLPKPDL